MSDQDFFFEEEEQAKAPKPAPKSGKGAPPKAAKGGPAPRSAAKTPQRSEPARSVASAEPAPSMFDQNVTLAVAALMTVIGLLLGLIVGFVWGGAMDAPATQSSAITTPAPETAGTPGALTPEQLSGGLPAGHVPVTGAATTTP